VNASRAPVVEWRGSDDPEAPLVVLLHGRGSDEADIVGLADHLPQGPAYAAVRAPIAEGGGYAWFANRGIGRPVAGSLRETMDWFRTWLDDVAPPGRPVLLVGFSGGAAFAGGLVLDDPGRYAGAAVLYGTLPFDAGVPTGPGRLDGVPVLVLGLTYRHGVKELAYSRALPLIERLRMQGAQVFAHDPLLGRDEVAALGAAPWEPGDEAPFRVVVSQTGDPAWVGLDWPAFRALEVVYDGRGTLEGVDLPPQAVRVGVGLPAGVPVTA